MSLLNIIVIGRMVSAIACVCIAGYLAMLSLDGWGWFLFIAFLLGCITGSTNDKKSEAA